MTPNSLLFMQENSEKLSSLQAQFINFNLDKSSLITQIEPILHAISSRIQTTYKSDVKITYNGFVFPNNFLAHNMQFDDVCIKVLHVDTGNEILIVLGSHFARILLIRLLSTSLINEYSSIPFSWTEKGIFSFIIARLLYELKNTLNDKMPNLKLLGVYHAQDEAVCATSLSKYIGYNFLLSFANSIFPISIAAPIDTFSMHKRSSLRINNLLSRCGHILHDFTVTLKKLSISQTGLQNLAFGDLIMFDHSDIAIRDRKMAGPITGIWNDVVISGMLKPQSDYFAFQSEQARKMSFIKDINMDEIEITHQSDSDSFEDESSNNQLASLAKNIRVNLSVEVARIPMTLREICNIREGEIIDLHRKIEDPLDLVVEGKVIGYCQPVQIEGRLGIRVLEIIGNDREESM